MYGKKVDSKKCEVKFNKLSEADIEKIFEVLPAYVASKPDKQFRKNPQTWLNGKCWNDEIENSSTGIDCGIDFEAIKTNFNKSMEVWPDVPVVSVVTDSQKQMISVLVKEMQMTDERFAGYFNHIATSEKFKYFVDGINIPALGLTFFLKLDTIQK